MSEAIGTAAAANAAAMNAVADQLKTASASAPAAKVPATQLIAESLNVVVAAAPQIQAVTRMSPRSQATFQLGLGLFAAIFALLAHHNDPAA